MAPKLPCPHSGAIFGQISFKSNKHNQNHKKKQERRKKKERRKKEERRKKKEERKKKSKIRMHNLGIISVIYIQIPSTNNPNHSSIVYSLFFALIIKVKCCSRILIK